jgi:Family of unknown function (DUF6152)
MVAQPSGLALPPCLQLFPGFLVSSVFREAAVLKTNEPCVSPFKILDFSGPWLSLFWSFESGCDIKEALMARYSRSVWLLGCALLLLAVPVFGHHGSASVYDPNNKITLKGTVTKLLWANPHIEVYFDAVDPVSGKMVNWQLGDGQGVQHLYKNGWRQSDLKVGETITVTGATRSWNDSDKNVKTMDYRLGGGVITNSGGEKVFTALSKEEVRGEAADSK